MLHADDDIPEGFTQLDADGSTAPPFEIVEADRWRTGAIVEYRGVRQWSGARGTPHTAHTVVLDGVTCGIWSTADLDRLFKLVVAGERVFVRYRGSETHPTLSSGSIHRWTVARQSVSHRPDITKPELSIGESRSRSRR